MKAFMGLLVAVCLLFTGCIQKRQPASAGGSKPAPAPASQPNAVEKYATTLSSAPAKAATIIDLSSIQRAIQQFQAMEGRLPKSLEELVAMHYMPQLPKAPPGKKLSYDPASGKVSLVDG